MNESLRQLEFDEVLERIAGHAAFSAGAKAVRALRPQGSSLFVQRELKRCAEAYRAEIAYGGFSFSGFRDLGDSLTRATKGAVLSISELVVVASMIRGSLLIRKERRVMDLELPALDDLIESLSADAALAQAIEHCFTASEEVLDQASPTLSALRKQQRDLSAQLQQTIRGFMQAHPESLTSTLTTLRMERQVVSLRPSDKHKYPGLVYGSSASGQTVYFEPAQAARINDQLVQNQLDQKAEILQICRNLSERVRDQSIILQADYSTCVLLDSLFARARWAKQMDGCFASMGDHLELEQVRHPLLDPQTVVANTYRMLPPIRMILISGPNTGGKSVALKTIGLSVALSLAGCPVPARSVTIPFCPQILVDMGDRQSITQSLSTFSGHMKNIVSILDQLQPNALVLLDEIGSGTDPLEGEALAVAILDALQKKDCYVVATTHYGALKEYAAHKERILISSMDFDLATMRPTYHYHEHVSGASYALEIAAFLKLDPSILQAAKAYRSAHESRQQVLIRELDTKIRETQILQDQLNQKQQELSLAKEALAHERKTLSEQQEVLLARAKDEADAYLETVMEEAQSVLAAVRKTKNPQLLKQLKKESSDLSKSTAVRQKPQVNDQVQIEDTHQVGRLIRLSKDEAEVQIGKLTVRVNPDRLLRIGGHQKRQKASVHHTRSASGRPSLQLNLIGMRVEEALPVLQQYLDSCLVYHLPQVRIVHGFGTGALRQAVHDELKKNPAVRSFRLGGEGEGGQGATVVVFSS